MRMRIPGHRTVVLLGITLLMVLGCQTPPGPLLEGERTSPASPAAARHPLMEGEACRTLENIDSLMWQQPDSAFALLQAFAASPEADSLDEFDIHYFQLLLSELLYKNDCEQTNRKDLLRAVAYYDSIAGSPGAEARGMSVGPFRRRDASHASAQTTAFLAARAHYINGVGYYERDSVVEACKEYLKALETMEERFAEKELVGHKAMFMTYTYNRLGEMFSEQFMTEQAIECLKKTFAFNSIEPISRYGIPNAYYHTGIQYDVLGEKDTAFAYYNRALEALPDTNNSSYRDISTSIALLNYQINHEATKSLKDLYWLSSQASNDYERSTRFLSIGSIYFLERQYDSALLYLEMVYEHDKDVAVRIQVAEYLLDIYQSMGNENKTSEYTTFLSQYAVAGYEQKAVQSQLANTFENYQRRKAKIQNDIEKSGQRQRPLLFSVLSVLLFVTATIFSLRWKHKKKLRMTEETLKLEGLQYVAELNDLRGINLHLKCENEKLVKQSKHQPMKAKAEEYEALLREAICIDLLQRFGRKEILTTNKPEQYAELAITPREKQALVRAVMKHCPDFDSILRVTYPTIKAADLDVCRFFLIGLSEQQIAVLLQKDYSTIWRRTKRLKEMMDFVDPKMHLQQLLFEIDTTG